MEYHGYYFRTESELLEENSLERHESVAAVIPAMLTDNREKQIKFSSRNGKGTPQGCKIKIKCIKNLFYFILGYIGDLNKFSENIKFTNIWTEEEKNTFKEKFYQCPKNFEFIASCLKNKVRY